MFESLMSVLWWMTAVGASVVGMFALGVLLGRCIAFGQREDWPS